MQADLVLFNGRVYTLDADNPRAQAVALKGKRILAVGDDAGIRALLHPRGRAVDLKGRTVIPGMIDAHVHFGGYSLGIHLNRVDLDNVATNAEALDRVGDAARQLPAGHWIQGGGWNKNIWPDTQPEAGGFPAATDLDSVTSQHPIALEDKSRHATWVNTSAMRLAGITAATADPPGGQILRDESGEPSGILLETASELVFKAIPEQGVDTMVDALRQGTIRARRLGLTGFHEPGSAVVLAALQILRAGGELGLRALVHLPGDDLEEARQLGLRSGFGDEYLRIGGLKIFADGALGPQTAHMLEPYEGSSTGHAGIPTLSAEALRDLIIRAHQAGLSATIHAIGDAANRAALDAIQHARSQMAGSQYQPALPDRIEHVQLLHPADAPRLAQLGVVASMQPVHATSDMEMAEHQWGRRSDWSYAWRGLLDLNTTLAFGSDCPIETLDPLAGIHAAVTRRRADGSPGPEGWIPAQRLTVVEAIHAYTLGAAHAAGEARIQGSLVASKLADLVVLSQDIFQIDPMEILDVRVEMTLFDGQIVYEVEA